MLHVTTLLEIRNYNKGTLLKKKKKKNSIYLLYLRIESSQSTLFLHSKVIRFNLIELILSIGLNIKLSSQFEKNFVFHIVLSIFDLDYSLRPWKQSIYIEGHYILIVVIMSVFG